jgi:formate hydrogenlyase subunit 3/multisubunit Na+/H+ antiporter MnhD subunit
VFTLAPYMSENIVTIIGICLLIGAMAKSSQVGLHVWLPMAIPKKKVADGQRTVSNYFKEL